MTTSNKLPENSVFDTLKSPMAPFFICILSAVLTSVSGFVAVMLKNPNTLPGLNSITWTVEFTFSSLSASFTASVTLESRVLNWSLVLLRNLSFQVISTNSIIT